MQTALLHTPRTVPLLPGFALALAGKTVAFDVPRAVKLRLRSPEKMRVSEWAAAHRTVAEGAHEGPWRHELAPHTVKIMDTYGLPWVREVWFCGVEQSGKTNTMLNCLGWAADCDPGNIFYLMPTKDDSDKIIDGKMKPMLQRTERLRKYLSKRQDDTTMLRIKLTHGMTIYPAHSNSVSSMATWAAKHCFGDEVDKYPNQVGKETDPITLLKKRNRNYKGRFKRMFGSTCGEGKQIHDGTMKCHQVWEFRVKCPECCELVKMDAEHLVAPEGATHDNVDLLGVEYACSCGCLWDDEARESAIRGGRWLCVKGEEHARPAKVGFHHRAWECLDIPLAEIASAYLKAKTGDHASKVAWANGYEAVDYEEDAAEKPQLAGLADRAEGYAPVIPMEACILTAGVDVQADRLEVEVVAWGDGAQSWGMDYRQIFGDTSLPAVWAELDTYLTQRWRHESGEDLPIARAFVDSGFRSHQVFRFCQPRLARGVFAIKGASVADAPEVRGPSQVNVGGVKVRQFVLGTQRLKTLMFSHLGLANPGPGYCHLPDTYPAAWYEMLDAEHIVTRKVGNREVSTWEKVKSGLRNESIDLRVYALAALLSLRVNLKARVAELKELAAQRSADEMKAKPARRRPSGFVNKWKG